MRVLITGTTGFIGSRLALSSRERGHEVVALGRIKNDVERERAVGAGSISFARASPPPPTRPARELNFRPATDFAAGAAATAAWYNQQGEL